MKAEQSSQSSFQKYDFDNSGQKLCKSRYQSFLVQLCLISWRYFMSLATTVCYIHIKTNISTAIFLVSFIIVLKNFVNSLPWENTFQKSLNSIFGLRNFDYIIWLYQSIEVNCQITTQITSKRKLVPPPHTVNFCNKFPLAKVKPELR